MSGKHRPEHFQDAIVEKSKQQQQTIRNFISFTFFVLPHFIIPQRESTVESRSTDTHLIRTPIYKGHEHEHTHNALASFIRREGHLYEDFYSEPGLKLN